jgi:hypothetical protein
MDKRYVKLADGRVIELAVPPEFDDLPEEEQTTFLKGARDQYLNQETARRRSERSPATPATPARPAAGAEPPPTPGRRGRDAPWWEDFGQGVVSSYTGLLDMIGKGTQMQAALQEAAVRPESGARNFKAAREAITGGQSPVEDFARDQFGFDGTIEDAGDRFASGLGGYFAPGFGAYKGIRGVGDVGREALTAALSGAGNEAGFQLGEGMGPLGQTGAQIVGSTLGGAAGYGAGNWRQFGPGGGNVADAAHAALGDVPEDELLQADAVRTGARDMGVDLTLAQALAGRGANIGPATSYIAGTPEGSAVSEILNRQPQQIDQLGQGLAARFAPEPDASQAVRNRMFDTVRQGQARVGREAADINFLGNRDAFAQYLETVGKGIEDIPPQRQIPVRRRPGTGPTRTPVELAVLGRPNASVPPVAAPRPQGSPLAQQELDFPNPERSQMRQVLTGLAIQVRGTKSGAELDGMIERELAQLEEWKNPPTVPARGGNRNPKDKLTPMVRQAVARVLDGPAGRGNADSAAKAAQEARTNFANKTPAGQLLQDGPYKAATEGAGNFGAMMSGAGAQGKSPITALYAQIDSLGGRDALNAYVIDWLTGKLKKTGRRTGGTPDRTNPAGELRMTGGQAEHSTVSNVVENLWRDDAQKDNVIAALEGLWTTQGKGAKEAREAATGFTEFLMLADLASRGSGRVGIRTSEMENLVSKTWLQHFANFNALAPLRQPARAYVRNMTSRNREEFSRLLTDPEMFPLLVELSRTPRGKISKIADLFQRIVPASNMALQSNEDLVEEEQQ